MFNLSPKIDFLSGWRIDRTDRCSSSILFILLDVIFAFNPSMKRRCSAFETIFSHLVSQRDGALRIGCLEPMGSDQQPVDAVHSDRASWNPISWCVASVFEEARNRHQRGTTRNSAWEMWSSKYVLDISCVRSSLLQHSSFQYSFTYLLCHSLP